MWPIATGNQRLLCQTRPPNWPPGLQAQWVLIKQREVRGNAAFRGQLPLEKPDGRGWWGCQAEGPSPWYLLCRRCLCCLYLLTPPSLPRFDPFSVPLSTRSLPLFSLPNKGWEWRGKKVDGRPGSGGAARGRRWGTPRLYSPLQEVQRFSPNQAVWGCLCPPRRPWSQGHRLRCSRTLGTKWQGNKTVLGGKWGGMTV